MIKIIISIILLGTISLLSAVTENEIKTEAKKAIMQMGAALKSHMKQNMKSGGPIQAANFCIQKAQNITHGINSNYPSGIHVKRISLKYRNPANKPSTDEKKVLQQIQKSIDTHKTIPKLIIKKITDNTYKVYKPIFIDKGVCLVCHGEVQSRDTEAYKLIKMKYPDDKAVNYRMGDLRGAFVATIIKLQ